MSVKQMTGMVTERGKVIHLDVYKRGSLASAQSAINAKSVVG